MVTMNGACLVYSYGKGEAAKFHIRLCKNTLAGAPIDYHLYNTSYHFQILLYIYHVFL